MDELALARLTEGLILMVVAASGFIVGWLAHDWMLRHE